jgi:hypothetical protein
VPTPGDTAPEPERTATPLLAREQGTHRIRGLVAMFALMPPTSAGPTSTLPTAANKGVILAIIAMAQTWSC